MSIPRTHSHSYW